MCAVEAGVCRKTMPIWGIEMNFMAVFLLPIINVHTTVLIRRKVFFDINY